MLKGSRLVLAGFVGIIVAGYVCPPPQGCQQVPPVVDCATTMALGKSPTQVSIPTGLGPLLPVSVQTFCRSGPTPGAICPDPPQPISVPAPPTTTVSVSPCVPPTCPAPCPTTNPGPGGSSSQVYGVPPFNCSAAGSLNTLSFQFNTAGWAPGCYLVSGSTVVTFDQGRGTITAVGDQLACIVEESPVTPGVPRLDVELLGPDFLSGTAGDQMAATYRITNNDSADVIVNLYSASKQTALMPDIDPPPGPGQTPGDLGIYSISVPGDDFPVAFAPPPDCIDLPEHPYHQGMEQSSILLIAGASQDVDVSLRSWGQCATGSCVETYLIAAANYAPDDTVVGCAGTALFVDTSLPPVNWAADVFDCNNNSVPDSDDIWSATSADVNIDAIPDECNECLPYALDVHPDRLTVSWQSPPPTTPCAATGFDVAKGSLSDLTGGGGFAAAECLVNNTDSTLTTDGTTPPAGDGFWYLTRVDGGGGWKWEGRQSTAARDADLAVCN